MINLERTSVLKVVKPIDIDTFDTVNLGKTTTDLTRQFDKASFNSGLEKRKTVISDDFWDRFLLLAKVCYMHDREADLYDVFDTMRTKILGGWDYSTSQLKRIDQEINEEYGYSGAL